MRVIDANLGEVRALAVSPDVRFVAASGDALGAFRWASGEPLPHVQGHRGSDQVAYDPVSAWIAHVSRSELYLVEGSTAYRPPRNAALRFSGGIAVSPDGKALVATTTQTSGEKLLRWALPGLRPLSGFDYWPPCEKLSFSPDGEFLAGIWSAGFELRFAASGGLDYRHRMPPGVYYKRPGFVSFSRDSGTCAFGWEDEFHVLDVSTGTSRPLRRVKARFTDAAFLAGQDAFATVGGDGRLKRWNPETWAVVREYDWGCGPLTCLAFSADGSAGVCGTADGKLVQFDVDE
jgi:WD40 repeat protein